MSFQCTSCKKTMRKNQHAILCDQCGEWTHRVCGTGLSAPAYRDIMKNDEDFPFRCASCQDQGQDQDQYQDSVDPMNIIDIDRQILSATFLVDSDSIMEDTVPDVPDINLSVHPIPEIDNELERSLADCSALDPPVIPEFTVGYTVVEKGSQMGKKKLVDTRGFAYVISKSTTGKIYWRCSARSQKCTASVIQTGECFQAGKRRHVHQPEPGQLTIVKVRAEIKERAVKDVYQSGSSIVKAVQLEMVDPNQPAGHQAVSTLVRMANKTREDLRPKKPRTHTI